MNFAHSDKVRELQQRVGAFMERCVYPAESRFQDEVARNRRGGNPWLASEVVEELKREARSRRLWNLFLPESEHGAGLTNLEYAPLCEIMGRSPIGAGSVQLLGARHRQHGSAGALRHRRAAEAVARAAAGRRDPLLLRHDRAGRRLVRRDQHRGAHRARRRRLRHQRPQVVDLGRRRSALQDLHLHGQDRSRQPRATSSSR